METSKSKNLKKAPHPFIVLLSLLLLVAIASYVVPAGQYETMESGGRTVYIAGTYQTIEKNPVTVGGFLTSIIRGMQRNSSLIFFVLIIAASFNVINETGVISKMTYGVARRFSGSKAYIAIPVFSSIFLILGTTMGFSQECLLFLPLAIALSRSLGFDAVIGEVIVVVSSCIGCAIGVFNPFSTGVAQSIAELPLYKDAGYRAILLVVFFAVAMVYAIHYAKKITVNPELSLTYEAELEAKANGTTVDLDSVEGLKGNDWAALTVFVGGLAFLVYGVSKLGWWYEEMSALFLAMGVICGFLGKLNVDKIIKAFTAGMASMVVPIMCLGLAGAIITLMTDTGIIDTIVYVGANMVQGLPAAFSSIGMFILQCLINLPIPSGTSQAAVTMPIMVPISDLVGVSRETAVLAFCYGDGLTNLLWPTPTILATTLPIAGIAYGRWVKWYGKLFLYFCIVIVVSLVLYANVLYPV